MDHKVGFIVGLSKKTGTKKLILQVREIKEKLIHWESVKPSDAELNETQKEVDNIIDSLNKIDDEYSKIQEDLADMRSQLEAEIERRKELNKDVVGLQAKVFELEGKLENLNLERDREQLERLLERQLMLLRQLASSYQYNAVKYVEGCSTGRFMHAVTHEQLGRSSSKAVEKASRFAEIESKFFGSRFSKTEEINTAVKDIRELGTSISHPQTLRNGNVPNYDDLKNAIQECLNSGMIDHDVGADANLLLEVVKFLTEKNGSSNILASK